MPVNTVCEHAKCPNRGECFTNKTVSFLLLGDTCTRNCLFCGVQKGTPDPAVVDDSTAIIETIKHFDLQYVVLTSVTRDDLPDGGAAAYAKVIQSIKQVKPQIKIEVLTPDFQGRYASVDLVCQQEIFVFNHNLELIPSIYKKYRPLGNFDLSLEILCYVKEKYPKLKVKTGIMVGLGETKEEVFELISLLSKKGIDSLTIGQYLQPSKKGAKVLRFVEPDEYEEYTQFGKDSSLKVVAGPLVRSSYMAHEVF